MVWTYVPRQRPGSVSKVAIGNATVDAAEGAAEESFTHYIELVYMQSLLQEWLSGSVFGVTISIERGIVDEGVGATGRKMN